MHPRVRSANLAAPRPDPAGADRESGIDKRPVDRLAIFAPPRGYGGGSGVIGDTVGDAQHHGGDQKAVYAYAREELDHWEGELQRGLSDGVFGENLTTEGIDLEALLINQRVRVGDEVVLEVSVPRQPCATFAAHVAEKGWARRFAGHGRCGVYFRVVVPGTVRAGDVIEPLEPPAHDIDMRTAFAAAMGNLDAMERVVAARCLPRTYHQWHVERLAARR